MVMVLSLSLSCLLLTGLLQTAEGSLQEPALKLETNYTFQISLSSPLSVYFQLYKDTDDNALRMYTASEDASMFQPVLVSVKQCKGVTSWSMPFVKNGLSFNQVYRVLCPLLTSFTASQLPVILVDLSTSNIQPTNITLRVNVKEQYNLQLGQTQKLIASPINPSYLFFKYPPGVNEVKVKINSSPDTKNFCALASIQNVYCPEVQLMGNPDEWGKFQTMRSLAAFHMEKNYLGSPYDFFYVVLFVYPNDGPRGDCEYESKSEHANNFRPVPYTGPSRVKHVTITVETALSGSDYKIAIMVGLGVMFVFYLVTFVWIAIFDWWRHNHNQGFTALRRESNRFANVVTAVRALNKLKHSSGREEQVECNKLRPTLLSVLAGMHWKKLAKKAASVSDHDTPAPSATSSSSAPPINPFARSLQSIRQRDPPESAAAPSSPSLPGSKQSATNDYKFDKHQFPVRVLMSELGELDEHQRAFDGYPLYLLVVGTFYALPVYQLLVTLRYIIASGNEDVCYHNFLCAHPWELWGVPLSAFNNMFSNIAYFLLGIFSILLTYRRRELNRCLIIMNKRRPIEKRYGVPQNSGIHYAAGMAMMGQAIMSTAYHMCPSRDNFKFDTTFIYIQGVIGIHKLLQSRNPDKKPNMHLVMLFLAFLLFSVVVGTAFSESAIFWNLFSFIGMLVTFITAMEIYYRWQISLTRNGIRQLLSFYATEGLYPPRHKTKFVFTIILIILNCSIFYAGPILYKQKFASLVMMIFVSNMMLFLIYHMTAKRLLREITCWPPPKVVMFALLTVICWIVALTAYTMETIDWSVSPAQSRDFNSDCLLLGFYDAHDIWHFLGAFATFFMSMLMETLDDMQEMWTRDRLLTF